MEMQVAMPVGQLCNQSNFQTNLSGLVAKLFNSCKRRHLVTKFGTNACDPEPTVKQDPGVKSITRVILIIENSEIRWCHLH